MRALVLILFGVEIVALALVLAYQSKLVASLSRQHLQLLQRVLDIERQLRADRS